MGSIKSQDIPRLYVCVLSEAAGGLSYVSKLLLPRLITLCQQVTPAKQQKNGPGWGKKYP